MKSLKKIIFRIKVLILPCSPNNFLCITVIKMALCFVHEGCCETKVDHVDHARKWALDGANEKILWLDISVDETQRVKLLQSVQYL